MSHLCRIELGITGNPNISIAPRKKSRDARFASELEKCFVKNGGLGFSWRRPAHVFTVNASFIRSRRKMNLILWVGGCNRSELDMCFVQLGRELYCRPALDFHS